MCTYCAVGTQKLKNGVGDWLCADDRLEVEMIILTKFQSRQAIYRLQPHVEIVPM
jgi:hypothetical protein